MLINGFVYWYKYVNDITAYFTGTDIVEYINENPYK